MAVSLYFLAFAPRARRASRAFLSRALARKAGRPVRTVLTRSEEFLTLNRHPARFRIKLGARRDGTFVAKSVHAWWDTGAYADCGPSVISWSTRAAA